MIWLWNGKVPQGDSRLLLMDAYGSHLTYEFWSHAKDHKSAPWRLPPHATHLLQPLDVGIFQPVKHRHQEALESCIRLGDGTFDKQDFSAHSQWIRDGTFTRGNVLSAWRTAGLVPYDPQLITDPSESLNRKRRRDMTPPPIPAIEIMSHTPPTAKDVVDQGKRIRRHYQSEEYFHHDEDGIRFIKGATATARRVTWLEDEARSRSTTRNRPGGTEANAGNSFSEGWMSATG